MDVCGTRVLAVPYPRRSSGTFGIYWVHGALELAHLSSDNIKAGGVSEDVRAVSHQSKLVLHRMKQRLSIGIMDGTPVVSRT